MASFMHSRLFGLGRFGLRFFALLAIEQRGDQLGEGFAQLAERLLLVVSELGRLQTRCANSNLSRYVAGRANSTTGSSSQLETGTGGSCAHFAH